jgi:hypothetical protein
MRRQSLRDSTKGKILRDLFIRVNNIMTKKMIQTGYRSSGRGMLFSLSLQLKLDCGTNSGGCAMTVDKQQWQAKNMSLSEMQEKNVLGSSAAEK